MSIRVLCIGILSGLLLGCGGGGSGGSAPSNSSGGSNNDITDPATEVEPNDDTASATAISVPDALTGSVSLPSDEFDFFSFTLTQSAVVTIDLVGDDATMDLDLALYDQNIALIDFSASDTQIEQIQASLIAGVTYYVEVEAFDTLGQTSGYSLEISTSAPPEPDVETEPNDTFIVADAVDFPGAVTGVVNDTSDQADIFALIPMETGFHLLELTGQGAGVEDINLIVYALVGDTVMPIGISQTSGQFETLNMPLDSGQPYFLYVEAADTGSEDLPYVLSVQVSADGGGGVITDEVEPNNSFGSAFPVAIPGDLTGSLNDATDDSDVFILTPVQSGKYLIEMQGFAAATFDLDLAVFDQNQALLSSSAGPSQFESINITLAAGLPYYVVVGAPDTSGQTFTYDLTIDFAP